MADPFDSPSQPLDGHNLEFDPFADQSQQQFEQPKDEATTDEEDNQQEEEFEQANDQPIILGEPTQSHNAFAFADEPTNDNLDHKELDLSDTPLAKWEEERAQILAKRRAEALAAKEKQITAARKEIEKFYEDREAAIHKNVNKNRAEEKENRADLESVMQHGTLWEKVARLVDLTPSATKTYKRADLVRMRTLLVQLKNDNPSKK